jgi:hypothetical protein
MPKPWIVECRQLRAEDPKFWTFSRLCQRYNVSFGTMHWTIYPDKRRAYDRKRYRENQTYREKRKIYTRAYFQKNKEKIRLARREYWARRGKALQAAKHEAKETGRPAAEIRREWGLNA